MSQIRHFHSQKRGKSLSNYSDTLSLSWGQCDSFVGFKLSNMCDTMRGNTVCGGFRMNGNLEGSRVDDMNDLKMVSSNIAKSCICTRFRDVGRETSHSRPLGSPQPQQQGWSRRQRDWPPAPPTSNGAMMERRTMPSSRALLVQCHFLHSFDIVLNFLIKFRV